jgi:hypothetical protein
MIQSGIKPTAFRLVSRCLNQRIKQMPADPSTFSAQNAYNDISYFKSRKTPALEALIQYYVDCCFLFIIIYLVIKW